MMTSMILLLVLLLASIQTKLYQVVSQFRHGARYPVNPYFDGNATRQFWGELSAVGMRQHQTFGKMLRKDYIDNLGFLSADYNASQIQVYTTNYNRTFDSVRSQLYGLYPLGQGQKMPKVDLSYHLPPYSNNSDHPQPIFSLPQAYRTIPVLTDESISLSQCSALTSQQQKNVDSQADTYKEIQQRYRPFLDKMGKIFNISSADMNVSKISGLYDTITADIHLGRALPQEYTQEDYLNMRHLHYWLNYLKDTNIISKAVNSGKIKKILKDFDDRILNLSSKPLKWTFISSHDCDATCMMNDLNISSAACVQQLYRTGKSTALNCSPNQQYATNLIFQLHSDDEKQFYVKIRHDGTYMFLCERREEKCLYQEWKERVKRLIVNTQEICEGKKDQLQIQGVGKTEE